MTPKSQKRVLGDVDVNIPTASKKTKHDQKTTPIVTKPKHGENPSDGPPKPTYEFLLLEDLRSELKARDMTVSGTKPDLIRRLREADFDQSPYKTLTVAELGDEIKLRGLPFKSAYKKPQLVLMLDMADCHCYCSQPNTTDDQGFRCERLENTPKLVYHNMHVPDLRSELRKKNLSESGCKSELVARLKKADESAEDEKSKSVNASNGPDYDSLKVAELKDLLRSRDLAVSGAAHQLIYRLQQNDRDRAHEAKQELRFQEEIQRDGQEPTLHISVPSLPNYDAMIIPEVKKILQERGLLRTGSAPELRQRLRQSDLERSLPYKQAMEADAKKRRERFAEARKNRAERESSHDEFTRHWKKYDEVVKRGPNAKPLYDDFGYALSYTSLANRPRSFNRSAASFRRMNEHFDKKMKEDKEKAAILGVQLDRGGDSSYMDWVVARDLKIPAHTVEMCDYQEWKRMGFTTTQDEVDPNLMSMEERSLRTAMESGSAYRVGYVR